MNQHSQYLHDEKAGHSAENEFSRPAGDDAARNAQKEKARHNFAGALARLAAKEQKRLAAVEQKARDLFDARAQAKQLKRRLASQQRRMKRARSAGDRLLALVGYKEALTTIMLAVVSAGIGLLTYSGISMPMSENGAGLVDKGHALSVAITMGVLSFLGWSYTFGVVHWLRGARLAIALSIAGTYIFTVAAVDAQYNMLGLNGPAAVQLSLLDTSRHYEGQRQQLAAKLSTAKQLVPALRAQASRFAALQVQEIKTGAYSGRSGPGKVSEAFGQIATLLTSLADDIEGGTGATASLQADVTAAIATLKSHVFTLGDIRERSRDVSAAADHLDELFGQLTANDYSVSMLATLSSLETLALPGGSTAGDFAAVQNAELAAIAEMAKPVAQSLRDALPASVADEAHVEQPAVTRPMSAMSAIRHYWLELLPGWILAFAIDLLPALLVVVLVLARREAENISTREGGRA